MSREPLTHEGGGGGGELVQAVWWSLSTTLRKCFSHRWKQQLWNKCMPWNRHKLGYRQTSETVQVGFQTIVIKRVLPQSKYLNEVSQSFCRWRFFFQFLKHATLWSSIRCRAIKWGLTALPSESSALSKSWTACSFLILVPLTNRLHFL